jgi:CheY-like chemotaxis protein/HPt (histidine-containing phosphotransfer) domain-containing protein
MAGTAVLPSQRWQCCSEARRTAISAEAASEPASILVGEDHPASRVALDALLERCGVKADYAGDGAAVVEATNARPYRVILLDLIMPRMSGFEAARQIRRLEYATGRRTPIVAVTAVDPDYVRDACIEAGIDDCIVKPIDLAMLREKLQRWLPLGSANVALRERRSQPSRVLSIDREGVEQPYGADKSTAILESFLSVTDDLLEHLRTAISSQDPATTGSLAQELKGSGLAPCAEEVVRLSSQLERAARTEDWSGVVSTHRELTAAYQQVTDRLTASLRSVLLRQRSSTRH